MPKRLCYIAQPFRDGRPQTAYQFTCAVDAEEGGRILASRADGVLVYMQAVDDEAGVADEPEVLLTLGNLPDGLLAIDPPAPNPWDADAA